MTADVVASKRHSLAVLGDMIIAPQSAFEALRMQPRWGWAFVVTCALGMIGAALQLPASDHIARVAAEHDPGLTGMSAAEQEQTIALALHVQHFAWPLYPLIVALACGCTAGCFAIANAFARGKGTFATLFALATNIGVLNFGIAYLLVGALTALRGPDAFATEHDLLTLLPNAGWIVPNDAVRVQAFLTCFNPFQFWSLALMAAGLEAVAQVARPVAWGMSALVTGGGALLAAGFAH